MTSFGDSASTVAVEGAMARQGARAVSTRELSHSTHEVLREVGSGDGSRFVVTRHREPVAVLMSVRDAADAYLVSTGDLEPVDLDLDHDASPVVGALGGLRIHAIERLVWQGRLRGVAPRDRAALCRRLYELDRVGGGPMGAHPWLEWVPSGRWLFVCALPAPGHAVVHDLFGGRDLERSLMGDELWAARERQDVQRSLHGRLGASRPRRAFLAPPQRPSSGTP
jgi:antitoxin (DNA-binding transcriptional repressor) of toxin-antitoxin stability system